MFLRLTDCACRRHNSQISHISNIRNMTDAAAPGTEFGTVTRPHPFVFAPIRPGVHGRMG